MSLRYLTAGESHGGVLTGILDGMPAGVRLAYDDFSTVLRRRRSGYGRGSRQQTETDDVKVTSGLRGGLTTGAPIALQISNAVHHEHCDSMQPFTSPADNAAVIAVPLPGHADFAGAIKYGLNDCWNIRERASARETIMRVALSVPPRCLLSALGIRSLCLVEQLASLPAKIDYATDPAELAQLIAAAGDDFLTPDQDIIAPWKRLIDSASAENKSIGGTGAVIFWNLPIGLGSHTQPDRRLDSRLAGLLLSIPAVRGVEVGMARQQACGSCPAADPILYDASNGWQRSSNYAGGIEGGMTDGAPLIVRFHMKPLPANAKLASADLTTGQPAQLAFYRSDTQAVTAAAVVAESLVAIELASQIIEMTGGASYLPISESLSRIRQQQKLLPG